MAPYDLPIPPRAQTEKWVVKIYDNELLFEVPHLTITRKTQTWRVNLRTGELLDPPGGRWKDIDDAVRDAIRDHMAEAREWWDSMFPGNPIGGVDE